MKNEQKFYSALENIFIGEAGQKIEGKSGYVNLMKLKSQYFAQIKPFIEKEVNDVFGFDDNAREEAFQKLYTFFESYLNETGTPYFSQTPFHKNLYEKVYSEREDVALFWKTQRLYYVKSEANYHSLQNLVVDNITFNFDASQIEHQKGNEKKTLEFWATELTSDKVTFKVVYEDKSNSKWQRLKEYLSIDKPEKIRQHLAENFGSKENPNIFYKDNGLKRDGLKAKQLQNALLITNNDDLTKSVTVEFAIKELEDIDAWAKHHKLTNLTVREATFKKAQQLYKKQNEIDYFIHKDAEGFLKEQFDLFLYQYLFGDKHLGNEWTQTRIENIQKLKRIAHKIIIYIARFEDELKHIWEKKKIVKNVNYVFTIDRLFPKLPSPSGEGQGGEVRDFTDKAAISLVEKIIADKGFEKQIEEYKKLREEWTDEKGEEIKKEWKEFSEASVVKKTDIIKQNKKGKEFNEDYRYLPIDTKYFHALKLDFLKHFNDLEKQIDGTLIKSDNWQALNTILPKYREQIDLIYIDPPFNTGSDFDYKDKYQDSTWLTLMDNRLLIAKNFISDKGSFYLHLDENANHYGKKILEECFGKKLTNEIIWDKGFRGTESKNIFQHSHDTIFFLTQNENYIWNDPAQPYKDENLGRYNQTDENGNKYALIKRNRTDGTVYYGKTYPKLSGKSANDVIGHIPTMASTNQQRVSFKTQKPEELLKFIIEASSNINSIVFDYHLGSGTTAIASQKMNRKYLGVELGNHFYNLILPKFKRVLIGEQIGISEDVNWQGGGFFKYYELEQYEECLARTSYNPKWLNPDGSINNLEQIGYYTFKHSEKLLTAMLIDEEKEEVKIHFQTLYPEMDEAAIAETISNVSGKKIKRLNKEKVTFDDDTEIVFSKMNYYDPIFKDHYRALLWWKSSEL